MWHILGEILEVVWTNVTDWRFNLCLTVGIVLAFVAVNKITTSPLQWIVAEVARLALDARKACEWKEAVRDARR
jgi:hypothetical protein